MDDLAVLNQLGSGKFLSEIAEHLAHVSQEVVRTGNKGAVTATLTVERFKDTVMVTIGAQVQPKPPAEKPLGAMFYALGGDLHRDDPRQVQMDFRVVDTETGEIRTIEEAEAMVRSAE